MTATDQTTQSNYTDIASEHVHFDWAIDWPKQVVRGSALHTLRAKRDGVSAVIFDTSFLAIEAVEVEGTAAKFVLGDEHAVMGAALTVPLAMPVQIGATVDVKVTYATTAKSTALQWLDKDQTSGKTFEYLFSQCQPIYARSLTPVQDTPSVKITYSAAVTSVLPVLLSAIRVSPPADGPAHAGKTLGKDAVTYTYKQPVPIPSYLIAIASGNVVYKQFPTLPGKNWTSGVWAEPEVIEAANWEFSADTPRFIATAEKLIAPYVFGVYDMLVLPPSFPYGGMENACLTFLTPTLLAGDRTMVDVVVHELTHSFFGNGVTHADASHFWLNEGWTTYIERVLQQAIYSPAERGFAYVLGRKSLDEALAQHAGEPRYQRLVIDFARGEDPDSAYSTVPYEKGSNFLLHIERVLGGLDVFLPFIQDYVRTFTGKSITTETWKAHLYAFYEKHDASKIAALDAIDWNAWLYGEGLTLPVEMTYDTSLAERAYALAARWDAARDTAADALPFAASDLDGFNANQKLVFLERLHSAPPLPAPHVHALARLYGCNAARNAEIRARWYALALAGPAGPDFAEDAAGWVVDRETGVKGRMKYCRPLFRALNAVRPELARNTHRANAASFHPIARRLIEKDLGLAQ